MHNITLVKICQACSVLKRKKIGLIPVQTTAKSRRLYKMRGSRAAVQGRPRHGQRMSVQLDIGEGEEDDGGVLRHKLPSMKRKTGPGHSLSNAVSANKRSTKKH